MFPMVYFLLSPHTHLAKYGKILDRFCLSMFQSYPFDPLLLHESPVLKLYMLGGGAGPRGGFSRGMRNGNSRDGFGQQKGHEGWAGRGRPSMNNGGRFGK